MINAILRTQIAHGGSAQISGVTHGPDGISCGKK